MKTLINAMVVVLCLVSGSVFAAESTFGVDANGNLIITQFNYELYHCSSKKCTYQQISVSLQQCSDKVKEIRSSLNDLPVLIGKKIDIMESVVSGYTKVLEDVVKTTSKSSNNLSSNNQKDEEKPEKMEKNISYMIMPESAIAMLNSSISAINMCKENVTFYSKYVNDRECKIYCVNRKDGYI